MSAIVEIKVPIERMEEMIGVVWEVEKQARHGGGDRGGRALRRERRGGGRGPNPARGSGYKLERAKTNTGWDGHFRRLQAAQANA